jgi:regulator of sigma E protease
MRNSRKLLILASILVAIVLIYKFWGFQGPLAFIFILGAAVVLHEFGHFAVAKLLKIRVETFSVGFGPRLFGKRWGQTDYRVSAIPLGGYVKLGGDESNAPIEGAGASDIPPEEMFNLRPRWQRIAVALAGPIMNILTALTISAVGAMWVGVPAAPAPVVKAIKPGGAAQKAGLQINDRIVSFNGEENPSWNRISGDALLSPDQPVALVVERNGQRVPLTITPTRSTDSGEAIGRLDFQPDFGNWPVVIDSVVKGMPAAEAGLQPGDQILAINDKPVTSPEQVTQLVQENKSQPIRMKIRRNGQEQVITASVRRGEDGTEKLGFLPGIDAPLVRIGPIAAISHAVRHNIEILRLTGKALGQLFSGQRSARDTLSGPIGIARASTMAVKELGWAGVFSMLGFLSLNLGIFNLLPIPVLDGGAIFLLLVEGLLALVGVSISTTVRERIQQVGFVMVLLLMVFVITNDLMKEASRWRAPDDNKPAATAPQK